MSSPSRTAIVTGAANGIGRAIALRLADDGFNIAICDLPSQEEAMKSLVTEIETKGRKVHAGVVNVSIEQQVNDFISTVVAQLGGLDVVRVMVFLFCFFSTIFHLGSRDGGQCGCGCPQFDPCK